MANSRCIVCNLAHSEDESVHNSTKEHRFNFMLYEWNNHKKALCKNRHGIEIDIQPKKMKGRKYSYTVQSNGGKHTLNIKPSDLSAQNNKLEFVCIIKNIRKDNSMLLTSAMLLYPNELFSFTDSPSVTKLNAGASYTTTVKFNIGNVVIGSYKNTVAFSFQTSEAKEETFTIARSIIVSVEDPTPKPQTATKSPFTRSDWHETKIVVPPTKRLSMNEKHSIPANLYPILKLGLKEVDSLTPAMSDELSKLKEQLKPGYVTASNYQTFWHTMLWMEEISQVLMLKRFNMENVQIVVIGGQRLELEVPGLAEKRPSLIIGDLIDIRLHKNNKAYRGVIRVINDKTVYIDYVSYELVDSIRENPNIDLDVRFVLNRLPLERMHKAVDQVHFQHIPSVFPEKDRKQIQSELNSIRDTEFINESICTNHEQKTAVINIVNGTSGCSPYIVFGPPGTGKTVTIVEAILQLKNKTDKKILVCAPCNAACDMLTQKLMPHCTKKELIRVMSQTVDRRNLNPEILKYSNYLNRQFYTPPGKKLSDYRIVVTTLIHIGCYCGKYKPDVVFVDEAAQACEPEVSCALGMISKGNQIVLAGDPRQLGPCTASDIADKYGLGKSPLERLMDLELYSSLDPNYITMLKQNFRSHSSLLTLPNRLFYSNMLQPMAARSENDPLAKILVFEEIEGLKSTEINKSRQGQSIEFCSIISEECRQGKSPSYFNVKEVQMVLKYVQALTKLSFSNPDHKVLPEQIGVVTPYARQVHQIRDTLRCNKFQGVDVGTTESFQGREKRVIIISTVRAKQDLLSYDKKYNLGFVKHEKRFNVAITRAMSKLIVIGCAHVLATDDKWLSYIRACEELNSFCGVPYPKRTEEIIDDITRRFEKLHVLDSQHNDEIKAIQ